jgi:TPR repeat protein
MRAIFYSIALSCLVACASTGSGLREGKANFREGNYSTAFEQLKPLAEQGNADAQYALGYMYYYGKGTPINLPLARKWIKAAAAQGQPDASTALGMLSSAPTPSAVPPMAAQPVAQ